jgi:hypothetical protein
MPGCKAVLAEGLTDNDTYSFGEEIDRHVLHKARLGQQSFVFFITAGVNELVNRWLSLILCRSSWAAYQATIQF